MAEALSGAALDAYVWCAVQDVQVVDVHTHLLPPTHGQQLLWGIDEMLCYHYLVAELFMLLPVESELDSVEADARAPRPPSHDEFFTWPKTRQADLVFEELFVKRTPLSEACRGVITALNCLGLGDMLRDAVQANMSATLGTRLAPIRAWFAQQEPEAHLKHVFASAGVRYAVMTNIPFAPDEAAFWTAPGSACDTVTLSPLLRTALRVDPILSGDWGAICAALDQAVPPDGLHYARTIDGCLRYLNDWVDAIQPLYLMASTPAGFRYEPVRGGGRPACPAKAQGSGEPAVPTATELLDSVVLKLAAQRSLPIALKVGAVRGANKALRTGGDGVEVADLGFLWQLCRDYPHVKFLATVLSVDNQHELCVMARKFGNLHVYGCW